MSIIIITIPFSHVQTLLFRPVRAVAGAWEVWVLVMMMMMMTS